MSWTLIATITIGYFVGMVGWPRCSDAYDSGATAVVAYWLGSTLKGEGMLP